MKYVHNRHSPENEVQATEAYYSRDEVGGPLGVAGEKVVETIEKTTKVFRSDKLVESFYILIRFANCSITGERLS